jgi:hypothetical protein
MANNNSNFTTQEINYDIKETTTNDNILFNNTLIYILLSSLVVIVFFKLFCKLFFIHLTYSRKEQEEKYKRHDFNNWSNKFRQDSISLQSK